MRRSLILLIATISALIAGESPEVVAKAKAGALGQVPAIVFCVRGVGPGSHWYDNQGRCFKGQFNLWPGRKEEPYKTGASGMTGGTSGWMYGRGPARLSVLDVATGTVRDLLREEDGGLRDPCVSYDGTRILFSMRKTGTHRYHLYEIHADGSGLRQITDGDVDDIEPIYLPNDDLMFVSTRGNRFTPCNANEAAILYRCKADGTAIRCISLNQEFDNTPWVMDDGRISYMRWEYVSRNLYKMHHLWAFNPDGTGVINLWGNSPDVGNGAILDAKAIPGTGRLVLSHSPGHGALEHQGTLEILDPSQGPDLPKALTKLTSNTPPRSTRNMGISSVQTWRDPFPLSSDCFLAAAAKGLYVIDGAGRWQVLHVIPETDDATWVHEPRPLMPRKREPVLPDRVDFSKKTGTMLVAQAHVGRATGDLKPGTIADLMIMEVLPLAVTNKTASPLSAGFDGPTYFPMRALGTVPVESDGSAYFEVPAGRSIAIATRDKRGIEVQRMLSFTGVMPGETATCLGCHERRTESPRSDAFAGILAVRRPASIIQPLPGVPATPIDYRRDVQPVFDAKCVSCHNSQQYGSSRLILGGWRWGDFTASYTHLLKRGDVITGSCGPTEDLWNIARPKAAQGDYPPYTLGAGASRLIQVLERGHYDVQLSEGERNVLLVWIAANLPHSGTLASILGGAGTSNTPKLPLPAACTSCHVDLWQRGWLVDPGAPQQSVMRRAPLSVTEGGLALCLNKDGTPWTIPAADPGMIALGAAIDKAAAGYKKPSPPTNPPSYLLEMIRIGAATAETTDDPFTIDERYYQSNYRQYYPTTP
jgi:hypothetical protein